MKCEECDTLISGDGVIFYEDVPSDVIQHHFCSTLCQDAYYEKGGVAAKAARRAVLAERSRIVALIREWPNRSRNWAPNPYMSPREMEEAKYYAVKDEEKVCKALATLIEEAT